MTSFAARVIAVVRQIPPGRVATYGDVAAMAGRPRASRAVGNIMRQCRDRAVPCQRVVAAGGVIGGYAGNVQLKKSLLRAEGLTVVGVRIREFAKVRWGGGGRPTGTRGGTGREGVGEPAAGRRARPPARSARTPRRP